MDLRTQVAAAVKEAREARNWRQKDVLDVARRFGANWSDNAISEIEAGRRRGDTADVLAILCMVFDTDAATLLGSRKFEFAGHESTGKEMLDALNGQSELDASPELPGHARFGGDNPIEVQRMAGKLGVNEDDLRALVMAVYGKGRRPIEVRDELAGVEQNDTSRSAQAKRGHASRKILRELQTVSDDEDVLHRGRALVAEWNREVLDYLDNL
ncbi:MAG: helix-turn-helix domain-containing protein [Corynebacterium variabile]|uniref:helix-turn-helix domain-containing protein n=1 Tax=Corynebacterium variabile TaxID=1727 RepID=UPI003F924C3A